MVLPLAATVAWGAAVYQKGDEIQWLNYARLNWPYPMLFRYIASNGRSTVSLLLELLPATLILPFVVSAWRRNRTGLASAPIVGPLLLYSGLCTAALVVWPGFATRYAMPIAPSMAVLAGIGWDLLAKSNHFLWRRIAGTVLGVLIVYQLVLVAVMVPVFSDRFGASRIEGLALDRAIGADAAPVYCFDYNRIDTNTMFYVRKPLHCNFDEKSVTPPAWLLIPRSDVAAFARLRPDLDVRTDVETSRGAQLAAARIDKKSGEK
jgi:hypothetical protein